MNLIHLKQILLIDFVIMTSCVMHDLELTFVFINGFFLNMIQYD